MSIAAFSPIPGVPSQFDGWPPHPLDGDIGQGTVIAPELRSVAAPYRFEGVAEYARPRKAGGELYTFARDWYDRLHLSTVMLDLGNIIGEQQQIVRIWNAYRRGWVLNSIIEEGTDGITISGQPTPPLAWNPLQERDYTITIHLDGPPVVDASITWDFPPYDLKLTIIGTRIVAWPFLPDWSRRGILERLEWRTDVLTHFDGSEQRRQLRLAPRVRYEFDAFFDGALRRYAETILWGWGARTWAVPIWQDGLDLPVDVPAGTLEIPIDPRWRDFHAGGLAIFLDGPQQFETLQVDSVDGETLILRSATTRDWRAGTRVYPGRTCRLSGDVDIPRWDGQASSLRAVFDVDEPVDYEADAGAVEYRGYPVLTHKPEWTGGFSLAMARKLAEIDNITGVRAYEDESGMPAILQRMRWVWVDRREADAYRKLLYWLRGRAGAIWVPTWEDDLIVTSIIAESTTHIDVEWCGYAQYIAQQPNRKDIRIQLVDGTVLYRRITSSETLSGTIERLWLDDAFGMQITPEQIVKVSFLALCRLEADAVEIAHWTGDVCESNTAFRGVRHDV